MSHIHVKIATQNDLRNWDYLIDQFEHSSIFHKMAWLKAAEKESKSELIQLVGYIGEKIILVLPLFFKRFIRHRFVFSPPPHCLIPQMGLIYRAVSKKLDAVEKSYFDIIDKSNEYIIKTFKPDFMRIINTINLKDVRPYLWNNCKVLPQYTYIIPLNNNLENIFNKFTPNTKKTLRKILNNKDLEVFDGKYETYKEIIEFIRNRYAMQGKKFPASDYYLNDLYENFGKDKIKIKAIRDGKKLVGGVVCVADKDTIRAWIGSINYDYKYKTSSIFHILHWGIIKDAVKNGFKYYDLVGGNTRHLCQSKARYNPDLSIYYRIDKVTFRGWILRYCYSFYQKWHNHTHRISKFVKN